MREFAKIAFEMVGLNYEDYLEIDEKLFRPNEVDNLLGSPQKIKSVLGWVPETSFEDLVAEMVSFDLENLS